MGRNSVFRGPAAALTVDGQLVAAAEEERFTRRKHGKRPVPFAAWDLPEQAAATGGFDERFPRVPEDRAHRKMRNRPAESPVPVGN